MVGWSTISIYTKYFNGKPIEIHGDGLQTRTFTFIEDTIQGLVKCIFNKNAVNDIFNIANEPTEEVTIIELAEIIIELMGSKFNPELKFIPYSTFGKYEDVRRRIPSIEKIKEKLDFQPKFKLKEGLIKTIDWQTKIYNSYDLFSHSNV